MGILDWNRQLFFFIFESFLKETMDGQQTSDLDAVACLPLYIPRLQQDTVRVSMCHGGSAVGLEARHPKSVSHCSSRSLDRSSWGGLGVQRSHTALVAL